jgi:hypothetical protein
MLKRDSEYYPVPVQCTGQQQVGEIVVRQIMDSASHWQMGSFSTDTAASARACTGWSTYHGQIALYHGCGQVIQGRYECLFALPHGALASDKASKMEGQLMFGNRPCGIRKPW